MFHLHLLTMAAATMRLIGQQENVVSFLMRCKTVCAISMTRPILLSIATLGVHSLRSSGEALRDGQAALLPCIQLPICRHCILRQWKHALQTTSSTKHFLHSHSTVPKQNQRQPAFRTPQKKCEIIIRGNTDNFFNTHHHVRAHLPKHLESRTPSLTDHETRSNLDHSDLIN